MDYGTDRVACPRCGRNNMPGKATCFGCGRSLLNASPVPLTRVHSKQSPPSRGIPSRKPGLAFFVFMVACCALLATFCIGAVFGSLQPKWSDAIWMIGALLVVAITFGLSPLNQVVAIPEMRDRLQSQLGISSSQALLAGLVTGGVSLGIATVADATGFGHLHGNGVGSSSNPSQLHYYASGYERLRHRSLSLGIRSAFSHLVSCRLPPHSAPWRLTAW